MWLLFGKIFFIKNKYIYWSCYNIFSIKNNKWGDWILVYIYILKDIIEIIGVIKRILYYYDEIGLLVLDKNDKNYCVYK